MNYSAGFTAFGSTDGEQPFWNRANRNGLIRDDQASGFFRMSAHTPLRETQWVDYEAGVDLVGYPAGGSELYLNQLYAKIKLGPIQAYGGRMIETHGIHEASLSSGSMGWSTNARPMPKIGVALPDWVALPWSRDFLHIRGHVAHGWFEESRYTQNAYLHEKTFYGKIGREEAVFSMYGGIMHYVVWGGHNPTYGQLPSSFDDLLKVMFATSGDEDAPPGDQDYMLGDHLGAWDMGFFLNINNYRMKVYRHMPLETKDNLKLKSPQDGLLGIHLSLPGNGFITGILYENLYTMWQDGPRVMDPGNWRDGQKGKENYYNHGFYRSGWTYMGRTLGNPLLLARDNTADGYQAIENNRVIAHHVGLEGRLNATTTWRSLLTHSQNHGQWGSVENPLWDEDYKYYGGLNQFSFLTEIATRLPWHEQLYLNASVAGDMGELYDRRFGAMMGVRFGR
ncbi:MAG: capsule assembly Wzi family protein [Balneolales bacterium]